MVVKKQETDLNVILTHILEDPWGILNTHTDIKEIVKNAQNSLKNRDLNFRKRDIISALFMLKDGLKNRKIDTALRPLINTSKKQWAKYVCTNYRVTTMNALNELCREVWGSRLPDNCIEEIKSHLHTPEKEERDNETDEMLSDILGEEVASVPAPSLEDSLKNKENEMTIQLGDIVINATEGTEISIKSLKASELKSIKNSSQIIIDRVEDGMLLGVKVLFGGTKRF